MGIQRYELDHRTNQLNIEHNVPRPGFLARNAKKIYVMFSILGMYFLTVYLFRNAAFKDSKSADSENNGDAGEELRNPGDFIDLSDLGASRAPSMIPTNSVESGEEEGEIVAKPHVPSSKPITPYPTSALDTSYPSTAPTYSPSYAPTFSPTSFPVQGSLNDDNAYPTGYPTNFPEGAPTPFPNTFPSNSPTPYPSTITGSSAIVDVANAPTHSPISFPLQGMLNDDNVYSTGYPTNFPEGAPTPFPTTFPSNSPTPYPQVASTPISQPTTIQTRNPTNSPTFTLLETYSTGFPTNFPEGAPTPFPTTFPSNSPTPYPQVASTPISHPTTIQTRSPTISPTFDSLKAYPTGYPTNFPEGAPTPFPTTFPSNSPTPYPHSNPTSKPTISITNEFSHCTEDLITIFLVDDSTSVGNENYVLIKHALLDFIEMRMPIEYVGKGYEIGYIEFSHILEDNVYIGDQQINSFMDLKSRVLNFEHDGMGADHRQAIKLAHDMVKSQKQKELFRPGNTKIILFFVTDGLPCVLCGSSCCYDYFNDHIGLHELKAFRREEELTFYYIRVEPTKGTSAKENMFDEVLTVLKEEELIKVPEVNAQSLPFTLSSLSLPNKLCV